jgi:hypothetical protein
MNNINKTWHLSHKMPEKATPKQRLDWHLAHAKNCGCRKLKPDFLKKLKDLANK